MGLGQRLRVADGNWNRLPWIWAELQRQNGRFEPNKSWIWTKFFKQYGVLWSIMVTHHAIWCCVSCLGLLLVASCSNLLFSNFFGHSDRPHLEWNLEVFPYSDLAKFGVYGKLTLSSFQKDWFYALRNSVKETIASGSKELELISVTSPIFLIFQWKFYSARRCS